jgi:hypothetical protein
MKSCNSDCTSFEDRFKDGYHGWCIKFDEITEIGCKNNCDNYSEEETLNLFGRNE